MINYIEKYFPELFQTYGDQFIKLEHLYKEWNSKINIVSRKDIDNIVLHHFVHSLAITKFEKIYKGKNILDIGTGGGLPGILLALIQPDSEFTLVDGRSKKIFVVDEIVKEMGLKNVRAMAKRSEEIKEKFDIITGRAVSNYQEFLKTALLSLRKGGKVWYWTGQLSSDAIGRKEKVYNIVSEIPEEYFQEKCIVSYCIAHK